MHFLPFSQGCFKKVRDWKKWKGSGGRVGKTLAARGAILLLFIVALEIAIMINPFAFYF
jgi:hypothetical protein